MSATATGIGITHLGKVATNAKDVERSAGGCGCLGHWCAFRDRFSIAKHPMGA
jgi:hypothetical protein